MIFNLEKLDIDPDAARQYIDARAAFSEFERTKRSALQWRGGMVWKTVDTKDCLMTLIAAFAWEQWAQLTLIDDLMARGTFPQHVQARADT